MGLTAGDRLGWRVTDDDSVTVTILDEREGALAELAPVETDEPTHAAGDHDEVVGADGRRLDSRSTRTS